MTTIPTRLCTSRWFVSRRPARKACRRYFAADKHAGRALGRLRYNDDRAERAELLGGLAADLTVDEGGRDVAESIRSEAMLVTWLRLAEEGAVPGLVDGEARTVLSTLAGFTTPSPDLSRRARLVLDLAYAMLPSLGGQAVEILYTIARAYDDTVESLKLPPAGTPVGLGESVPEDGGWWCVFHAGDDRVCPDPGRVLAYGFADAGEAREWAARRGLLVQDDEVVPW